MSKNILITGGAGYLGSILIPELLLLGHKVTVVDGFSGDLPSLATSCANEQFTPIRGDARDKALMQKLITKVDVIIPLAALVGAPLCARDEIATTTTNFEAIKIAVDLMSPNQMLVYPTTNSGYGIGEQGKYCTEDSPLKPISLYGKTKVDAEAAVLESGNGITYRLATVFGMAPKMRVDLLVNDFTYRAVTDRAVVIFEGHFKRNYIHIRDVARAFIHGIDNYQVMNNQPFNVGLSDANLSKVELCERIKLQLPKFTFLESNIGEDPDKRDYIVSNERLEKTGFRPQWGIDRGIAELIKGYEMLNVRRFTNV
jgi:nucleoside-diphosphate-sugar epimerase